MRLWIARDKEGDLYGYDDKPYLVEEEVDGSPYPSFFDTKNGYIIDFLSDLFPEVTFENSPQQVEINLIK